VVLALCVAFALLVPTLPAMDDVGSYNAEQRALGETINATVPEGEPVYVWFVDDDGRRSLMAASFYARRPYVRATPGALEGDPAVRYAVVPLSRHGRIDREHGVLRRAPTNGVALIEFAPAEANRSAAPTIRKASAASAIR
jgi:hypothetical protein